MLVVSLNIFESLQVSHTFVPAFSWTLPVPKQRAAWFALVVVKSCESFVVWFVLIHTFHIFRVSFEMF